MNSRVLAVIFLLLAPIMAAPAAFLLWMLVTGASIYVNNPLSLALITLLGIGGVVTAARSLAVLLGRKS